MPYAPNTTAIYDAAFSGAMSGMFSGAWLSSPNAGSYNKATQAAGAFAKELDAVIGAITADEAQVELAFNLSRSAFIARGTENATENAADYTSLAVAIAAAITEAESYFTAEGYTPPPWGGGSGGGGSNATIRIPIGTGASQSSTHKIPAGAIVLRAYLDIQTPYSTGATISLGTATNASLFMATSDSDPQVAALYDTLQDTAVAVQNPMLVTVAGAPAAGAGFAAVEFAIPLT